jgi:hypothetical protein
MMADEIPCKAKTLGFVLVLDTYISAANHYRDEARERQWDKKEA